ncbi:MAG: heme biosynthesis HemY N-terminal domain-containing protein [Pseudomonadota bacterium]
MILFIVFVILLAAIFTVGHVFFDYQGTVVIATESMVYDMKMIVAVTFVIIALIGIFIVSWLIVKIIRLIVGSKAWLGTYSTRQKNKAFYLSLNAFLMGDKAGALRHIGKTYGGDFHGANYLLAADLCDDEKDKQRLFAHALSESDAALAAAVNNADVLYEQKPEKALTLLEELPAKKQKHLSVVKTKLNILQKLKQWNKVRDLLRRHKRALGTSYLNWAQKSTHGEFAEIVSKNGALALKERWQRLPRAERNDVANQICYAELLLAQGFSEDVERFLVAHAVKNQHPSFWGLFKRLNHAEPNASKKFLENLIKKDPKVAKYYSVLAHVAFNSKDLELAHKSITKAIELEPSKEDNLLLATILEKQNNYEQANLLYREAMQ